MTEKISVLNFLGKDFWVYLANENVIYSPWKNFVQFKILLSEKNKSVNKINEFNYYN